MATCPKCNGTMNEGYILDIGYGTKAVSTWHSGKPQKSIWTGLKTSKKDEAAITTLRCSRCGYLESYAKP